MALKKWHKKKKKELKVENYWNILYYTYYTELFFKMKIYYY